MKQRNKKGGEDKEKVGGNGKEGRGKVGRCQIK